MDTGGFGPVALVLLVLVSNEVGRIGGGGNLVGVTAPVRELVVALMPTVETTSAEESDHPITGIVRVVTVPLFKSVTRVEKLAGGSMIGNVAESVVSGPLVEMLKEGVLVSTGVIKDPLDENGGSVQTIGRVAEFVIKEPPDMVGVMNGGL